MANNIFQSGGGGNTNSTASWSLGSIPTAGDGNVAMFNGTSPNATVNAALNTNNISFNGYTNNITMTFNITNSGSADFTGLTAGQVSGAGTFTQNATGAITGGGTWKNAMLFSAATTKTITGTLTVNGLFTSSTSTQTVNGGTLVLNGGLTMTGIMTGSTAVTLAGGTWGGAAALGNSLTFAGNSTMSGTLLYGNSNSPTIAYSSGTITTSGSTLSCNSAVTLNIASVPLNIILFSAAATHTLSADINCNTLNYSGFSVVINGAFNINVATTLTLATGAIATGTATVQLTGATVAWTTTASGVLKNNCIINTAGTVTFGASTFYNTGTLTVTAGTLDFTTNSNTMTIGATTSLVGVFPFKHLSITGTITIDHNLVCTGNLTVVTSATMSGAFTISCVNLTLGSSGATFTLSGNVTCSGILSSGVATSTTINGAFNLNCTGTVSIGTSWLGTATLNFTGAAFGGTTTANILAMNTTINTTGATFTSFAYRTNTLTWTAIGTSTFAGMTLLLNTQPTVTVNCTGIVIPILQIGSNSPTCTINGSQGFTVNSYVCAAGAASKVTWQAGNVYNIGAMSVVTTLLLTHTWVSSSPGTTYNMVLANGAVVDIGFMTVTDCDAQTGGGATFWNYKGTQTNCLNWKALPTQPQPVSYN